ncbi:class F sortase [Streptomyces beigongshangae]|uniref:class F sortase n=1 Tax=Streptomyces beigongshangae TaxID=2841597 RepID=UPI0027E0055B|nr:class F sortase [Streptomyces sp. REN17]
MPHNHAPRPWYRTRAYRLTRTAILTFSLVMGGIWWVEDDGRPAEPAAASAVDPGDAKASPGPPASTTPEPWRTPAPEQPPVRPPAPPDPSAPPSRTPQPLPRSEPRFVSIPSLGLDAPLVGLRLDGRGQLTAPPLDRPELAGWYVGGPTPGEAGTSVMVGHLDNRSGPAVFAGLSTLTPGRIVEARRSDGRTAVYTVDAVRMYEKARFPSQEVYGTRNRPELRLITCGGTYDRKTGYRSNVVVFAHLTKTYGPAHTT